MSSVENTENVLRQMHHLIARSDPFPRDTGKVIINKQEMLDLLQELSDCISVMMEDFELTKESRNRAELEEKRRNEAALAETQKRAEDIYAASILFTHDALDRLLMVMHQANEDVSRIYDEMETTMRQQEKDVRSNQMELKAQLRDLKDTEKYMGLVEERNREIEKEKNQEKNLERIRLRERGKREAGHYGDRQGEVKVNKEVLAQLGISAEDQPVIKEEKKEIPVVRVNEQFIPNRKPELTPKKKKEESEAPKEEKHLELADSVRGILKTDDLPRKEEEAPAAEKLPKEEAKAEVKEAALPEQELKAPERRREGVYRRLQQKTWNSASVSTTDEEKQKEAARELSAEVMGYQPGEGKEAEAAEDLRKVDLDAEYFRWQDENASSTHVSAETPEVREETKAEPKKKFSGLFKRK